MSTLTDSIENIKFLRNGINDCVNCMKIQQTREKNHSRKQLFLTFAQNLNAIYRSHSRNR